MDVRWTRHSLTIQDQAFRLRQLVVEKRRGKSPRPSAFRVGVRGVQSGVGATTVAKALHTCLRLRELGAEYIRAHRGKSPMGDVRELDDLFPLAERPILNTEATQLGHGLVGQAPGVLPADDALFTRGAALSRGATQPILEENGGTRPIVWMIADCESGEWEAPDTDWACFEAVVLVTTAEPLTVMAAYKWLKRFRDQGVPQRSVVVVNRSSDVAVGTEMGHRLQVACERFMAVSPPIAVLPEVPSLEELDTWLTAMPRGKRDGVRMASGGADHTDVWNTIETWWKGIAGLMECVYRLVLAGSSFAGDFTHRIGRDEEEIAANSTEENVYAGSVEDLGEGKQPKVGENR